MTLSLVIAALSLGVFSSSHCLFMCGGIASALSGQQNPQDKLNRVITLVTFHLGRLCCYALLGLILGSFIHQVAKDYHTLSLILRHIAGILLILIGLYIAGFDQLLKIFESKFSFIWRYLQRFISPYIGMKKKHHAFILGMLWGFLPCGIIYSTLLWASATTQGPSTAIVMFLFGLGTLPGFLLLNIVNDRVTSIMAGTHVRLGIGGLFMVFGIWTILSLFPAITQLDHPFCY